MYCPYCNFKVKENHTTVCPNCHHTLPETLVEEAERENDGTTLTQSQTTVEGKGALPPDYKQKVKLRRQRRRRPNLLHILLLIIFLYFFPLTQPYVKPAVDEAIDKGIEWWEGATSPYILIPEKTSYVLERHIYVKSTDGSGHFELHFPDIPELPYKYKTTWGKTIQEIKNFEITIPEGKSFVNESRDGSWLKFEGDLPEGKRVHIVLTYTVDANAVRWDEKLDDSNSATVEEIPQELKDQYNHDERMKKDGEYIDFIEVEKYRSLAENVTKEEKTVYGKLKAIYQYVVSNIQYVKGRDPKSCTETLKNGYGDCDDMSVVFISLARGVGIPSWMVFGQIANDKFTSWGGHTWVEAYVPTKDGGHYNVHIDPSNHLFLVYSPTRLLEWKETGDEDDLIYFYYFFSRSGGDIQVTQELETKDFSSSGQIKVKV